MYRGTASFEIINNHVNIKVLLKHELVRARTTCVINFFSWDLVM